MVEPRPKLAALAPNPCCGVAFAADPGQPRKPGVPIAACVRQAALHDSIRMTLIPLI